MPSALSDPGLARVLDRWVARLVWAVDPREVILFGSHTKGLANRESDIDLLVVTDVPAGAVLAAAAFDATRGVVKCDVVLRDPVQLEIELRDPYGFLAGLLTSAQTLYCRPGAAPMSALSALARADGHR